MPTKDENRPAADAKFSFAQRELQRVEQERVQAERTGRQMALADPEAKKDAAENTGFDPYNSSGSFDRHKAWERVGKR